MRSITSGSDVIPPDFSDARDVTDTADQIGQMDAVFHLNREFEHREFTLRFQRNGGDIGIRTADFGCDTSQNAFSS